MPARARRSLKCCYREGPRRCSKDGTGNPPLCRAHAIAVAEATRPKTPAEFLTEAFSNILQGKPVNMDDTRGLIDSVAAKWFGEYSAVQVGDPSQAGHTGRQAPRPPPPPPDPRVELRERVLAARRVMGFAAKEPLTEEGIKKRHRTLAKRHHPDLGGSPAKMAMINDATDVLVTSPMFW